MKKFKLSLLIALISVFGALAQTDDDYSNSDTEMFNSEQESLNFLSTLINNQPNSQVVRSSTDYNNSVFIQQIGNNNYIYSNTQSQTSDIKLIQLGDNNEIGLSINAPSIEADILQNGNNNSVLDNIYSTNQNVQLNLIQNGDNLTLNRIGVNSLTNRIKLVQEGSFKTITLISN